MKECITKKRKKTLFFFFYILLFCIYRVSCFWQLRSRCLNCHWKCKTWQKQKKKYSTHKKLLFKIQLGRHLNGIFDLSRIASLRLEQVEGRSLQLWAIPSASQLMSELQWRAAAVGRWLLCHWESKNPINMVIIQKVIYMIGKKAFFPLFPLHLVMRTANTIYETLCTINTADSHNNVPTTAPGSGELEELVPTNTFTAGCV